MPRQPCPRGTAPQPHKARNPCFRPGFKPRVVRAASIWRLTLTLAPVVVHATPSAATQSTSPLRCVAVVANGAAGALLADPQAEAAMAHQFSQSGLKAVFVPPDAGTLPERLAQARASGADAVVVAGGDGTIACAAAELLGTGTILGILPFGTMNLLAKDLGIPIGDTAGAIAVLTQGAVRAIDVGDVNGHIFLCASMLGLPAKLGRHRERGRKANPLFAWTRFAIAAVRALLRGRQVRLHLRTDTGERVVRAQSISITVNPLDAASGRAFGRVKLDGGLFGLYVIARLRLRDLPRLAWRAVAGRIEADKAVRESGARHLVIGAASRSLRVMNDGEARLLRPPLRYRIRSRALLVMAPRPGA